MPGVPFFGKDTIVVNIGILETPSPIPLHLLSIHFLVRHINLRIDKRFPSPIILVKEEISDILVTSICLIKINAFTTKTSFLSTTVQFPLLPILH